MRRLLLPLALAACAPGLPAAIGEPLATTAYPPALDALGTLAEITGEARILALGQPGPGSRELAHLVHRLFRHLSERSGFTGLALTADGAAATRLDAYVQGATLDIDAALLDLEDRDLATAELRDLLSWARERNASGRGPPLRVFGLDPRDPDAAAALVLEYLAEVDPQYVPKARSLLAGEQQLGAESVLARLDQGRDALVAAGGPRAWAAARQQAELVAQARRMSESWEFEAGEFARARNAEWALGQLGPQGKLLVWADNLGVARDVPGAAPSMGNFLSDWFGADYRAIAVTFAAGSLLVARDAQNLCAAPLAAPRPRSLDAALAVRGLALVDLRGEVHPALRSSQRLRGFAGARAVHRRLRPTSAFDAILNLPRVTAATPLGAAAHAAMYPDGPCFTVSRAP